FTDGKGGERIGNVVEMSKREFKAWLREGNTREAASRTQAEALATAEPPRRDNAVFDNRHGQFDFTKPGAGEAWLKAIRLDHLTGIPAAIQPHIRQILTRSVKGTTVYVVDAANMARASGEPRGSRSIPLGLYVKDTDPFTGEVYRRIFIRENHATT